VPCDHLNAKHTIFGQVVAGHDTLDRISSVQVDKEDRPLEPVLISRCGELERRKKKPAEDTQNTVEASRERGRRRSNDCDVQMEDSPEPRQIKRPNGKRRQSDNHIDEGLRGRPRQRSGTRSPSQALSSHSEHDSRSTSPAEKHKRKRSPSPSRHVKEGVFERRRRSLPNQYQDERVTRAGDDEERYKPSPRRGDHRYSGRRQDDYKGDRYRPSNDRSRNADRGRLGDDGRLGGGDSDRNDPPVKFKGRGAMKYRDPDRL